jgi:hypothetical protein
LQIWTTFTNNLKTMTTDQEEALAKGVQALKLVEELSKRVDKLEGKPEPVALEVTPEPAPASDVAPAQ